MHRINSTCSLSSEAEESPAPQAVVGSVTRTGVSSIPSVFVAARVQLVDDAIERAKAGGYTVYTTTLRAAWEAAIDSINDALQHYLMVAPNHDSRILADHDYRIDPRFDSLRKIAQFHRSLGVTLQMYIGLFKMFRDLYTDHFDQVRKSAGLQSPLPSVEISTPTPGHLLSLFFDEAEISMMASWSDTSDFVRKEELQSKALSASLEKDKYLAIFESLRDPAFLLDHDRALINANQMANTLFRANASPGDVYYNRQQQHLTLQHVVELACNATRQHDESIQTSTSGNHALGAVDHLWLETLQGNRCFDVRERNIQDACQNKAAGFVVILHDVTSHRQATEKAVRAEQEKSTFLATMSHEVRTPMHAILGATELMRHADKHKRHEYIDTIEATGQHLLETLTKVLDYSRLESGKQQINNSRNDFSAFIDKLELFAGTWARQARRTLHLIREADLPPQAVFDAGCTRQILHNLIANAITHGEGLISLSISREPRNNDNEESLLFDVHDQGRSLSNENLTQLFEPFYRGRCDLKGTGLGLAICRHLAESMGGSINALTCERSGTTHFRLRLPLIQAGVQPFTAELSTSSSVHPSRVGSVMLVDDEPVSAGITSDQLQLMGLHVDRFPSVAECLDAVQGKANDPASIWQYFVLDYQLPDSNGAVLARRLRSMVGSMAVRIVALTANTQLAQGDDGKAFDRILTKPASALDLRQALFSETHRQLDNADTDRNHHPFRRLPAASVNTIVQTFVSNWSEKLPAFLASLEHMTEPDLVRRQAHQLASSASSVGLVELTEDLRLLDSELSPKSELPTSGRYWLDRLENPMRQAPFKVRESVERIFSEPPHEEQVHEPL